MRFGIQDLLITTGIVACHLAIMASYALAGVDLYPENYFEWIAYLPTVVAILYLLFGFWSRRGETIAWTLRPVNYRGIILVCVAFHGLLFFEFIRHINSPPIGLFHLAHQVVAVATIAPLALSYSAITERGVWFLGTCHPWERVGASIGVEGDQWFVNAAILDDLHWGSAGVRFPIAESRLSELHEILTEFSRRGSEPPMDADERRSADGEKEPLQPG
ncbi:hypothetical protein Pla108_04990 [Botrimarina colliarenosi]|uniref:Uncharacterized protein n=1 Tax=Botrimarina colliarenosi TaxID=2528001 RepID=A0A5C6AJI4_9BACT|nr:hypothetical protein [Botrimarina colliarenosi]TWT99556.1 hypothetical protein Pla108_04990 [Botrimarina colliarenosi]